MSSLDNPTRLGVDRAHIRMPDRMVRAFSGRGAVSLCDHTVTGIQGLQFTPFEQPFWRFSLSFVEVGTGCVIEDRTDLVWAHHEATGDGFHPLGLNFRDTLGQSKFDVRGSSPMRSLVVQDSIWRPNELIRTGTFHKRISNRLISFGIRTAVSVDPHEDVIHLDLWIENRADVPLTLLVGAHQTVSDRSFTPGVGPDRADETSGSTRIPVWQWPGGRTIGRHEFRTRIDADLPKDGDRWRIDVTSGAEAVASFAIVLAADAATLGSTPARTGTRETAVQHSQERLRELARSLPTLRTPHPALAEFYDRCALTVSESTWERDDWYLSPFFCAGTWLFTLAWDTSFAAKMLASTSPEGLRRTILAFLETGLTHHSYVRWDGAPGHYYAYSYMAGVSLVRDFVDISGDELLRTRLLSGATVVERLAMDARQVLKDHLSGRGLLDFGTDANNFLENRTDGYQGEVAVANIMMIDALRWLVALDPEATTDLARSADALQHAVDEQLWDEHEGWFANIAHGRRELFWSYHLFEALGSDGIRENQQRRLIDHLRQGRFLAPFGMYSVAREDVVHWDGDDFDWGGGGQYTGMPLRIAEKLFQVGAADVGWDLLQRCVRWIEGFPYIPQEIAGAALDTPGVEQPLEIAAGAGVQAIIHGVFGVHPHGAGGIEFSPARIEALVGSQLDGYRHGAGSYTISLDDSGFRVVDSTGSARTAAYGATVRWS